MLAEGSFISLFVITTLDPMASFKTADGVLRNIPALWVLMFSRATYLSDIHNQTKDQCTRSPRGPLGRRHHSWKDSCRHRCCMLHCSGSGIGNHSSGRICTSLWEDKNGCGTKHSDKRALYCIPHSLLTRFGLWSHNNVSNCSMGPLF